MAPEGVKVYNPAFDVTDAGLITAIVTEKGIAHPPLRGFPQEPGWRAGHLRLAESV
jgi:methylthioribose-1-phosphate isomerase (EC 5.3.1.23)